MKLHRIASTSNYKILNFADQLHKCFCSAAVTTLGSKKQTRLHPQSMIKAMAAGGQQRQPSMVTCQSAGKQIWRMGKVRNMLQPQRVSVRKPTMKNSNSGGCWTRQSAQDAAQDAAEGTVVHPAKVEVHKMSSSLTARGAGLSCAHVMQESPGSPMREFLPLFPRIVRHLSVFLSFSPASFIGSQDKQNVSHPC